MSATKLISFDRLSQYDGLIKQYIAAEDAPAIKRIAYNSSTRVVSFYRTATAPATGEDTPYTTVTLPDTSSFIPKLTVVAAGETGTHAGDYLVVASDGTVESTGASIPAEDISIADAGGLITATDVEGALQELATAAAGGVAGKSVYITETAGSSSDLFSKKYGIYQGASGSSSSPVAGELLSEISIPKDMVVEAGSVADITYSEGHLYDGATDVTELIKGEGGTATAADAGKYIKLIIANSASSALYIAAQDLVDIYSAEQNASQVQLVISNSNVISASIVAGSVGATELDTDAVTTAKIADGNVTKTKLAQGVQDSLDLADTAVQPAGLVASAVVYQAASGQDPAVYVDDALDDIYSQIGAGGSVAQQIEDAINALDSSTTDIGVTATSGSVMNAITSLDITDGLLSAYGYTTLGSAALQADTYFLKSEDYTLADSTDISGLFSSGT